MAFNVLTTAPLAQTTVSSLEIIAFLDKLLNGPALPFLVFRFVLLLRRFAVVAAAVAALVTVLAAAGKVIVADFVHGVDVLGFFLYRAAFPATTLVFTFFEATCFR